MNKALYHAVYGRQEIPTASTLQDLAADVLILPDGIKEALFMHYQLGRSAAEIAEITNKPPQLIERWLRSGISLLQVFGGVYRQ